MVIDIFPVLVYGKIVQTQPKTRVFSLQFVKTCQTVQITAHLHHNDHIMINKFSHNKNSNITNGSGWFVCVYMRDQKEFSQMNNHYNQLKIWI